MVDGVQLAELLQDRTPNWDLLAQLEASAPAAAQHMHCSRKTALKSLKAAAQRIQHRAEGAKAALEVAEDEARLKNALTSTWPLAFTQLAERIERDGQDSVDEKERRNAVASLPRGISVRR